MQYEITQKGVHAPEGKDGAEIELEVGTTFELPDGQPLPGALVGKCRPVGAAGRTAVTNPAEDAVVQPPADRSELMAEACKLLEDEDFNDDGVPDVRAINGLLSEDATKFTAAERDAIWSEIADAVKAAREAG